MRAIGEQQSAARILRSITCALPLSVEGALPSRVQLRAMSTVNFWNILTDVRDVLPDR